MKTYIGERNGRTAVDPVRVRVWDEDHEQGYPLKHHVRHSPSGFNWGYSGSGPAELARSILIDFLGTDRVSGALYQTFKSTFIARTAQDADLTITEAQILEFLKRPDVSQIDWLDDEKWPEDLRANDEAAWDAWYRRQDDLRDALKAKYASGYEEPPIVTVAVSG